MKAAAALKSAATQENQLAETQQLLEEETRQKLALSSKLRQLESEKESLQEQLEEDEEMKKNYERKLVEVNLQMQELKKKAEEDSDLVKDLEEARKKSNKGKYRFDDFGRNPNTRSPLTKLPFKSF